jgi:integrase
MAFVRSWAEGLDLVAAWNRLLNVDGAGDARRARGELQRLLDELRALARAHGRPELAALLRRDPEAMVDSGPAPPSLDEFALRHPPDFYSQAELAELYTAEFGRADARSTARRRQRLRVRLLAALQWLEQVGARTPQPADLVSGWLDERVARRLAVVGIRTLGELQFWIRSKGFHWHRQVPRLGPQGAARIVRWMQAHAATLGALPAAALLPPHLVDRHAATPAPCIGIVPLERFVAPGDRDGSRGLNRAPQARCKLAADDDLAAIQAWLQLRAPGSHTWRAYRKEAERLLMWSVLVRGKALSSLDGDDCLAYQRFIAAPPTEWTASSGTPRWSDAWRPFAGALSASSQASAVAILRSLCAWLVRVQYLACNPWDDAPAQATARPAAPLRAFTSTQWSLVQGWIARTLAAAPASVRPRLQRLQFLLDFGSMTGLRLAELAAARLGWLQAEALDDSEAEALSWTIRVPGKGGQWREVPLPEAAMQSLRAWQLARGLHTDPRANDPDQPLVSRLDGSGALSAARIYDVLCDGFERCALALQGRDPDAAERIRQASTHWLRHTYGAHTIARGVPQDVVQAALGHQGPAMTAVYVRSERAAAHRAVRAAFQVAEVPPPNATKRPRQ